MTEFLVSQTNPSNGIATDQNWQNETFSSQRSPGGNPASASLVSALKSTTPAQEINLQEALEWLLGSPQPQDAHLSDEELESRKARRADLLVWLLNLELRLSPYGDPA